MRRFLAFWLRQGKIKEVKVRLDMVGILGARDDNIAALNVPAENDLGRGLAVLLAKLSEQRLPPPRPLTEVHAIGLSNFKKEQIEGVWEDLVRVALPRIRDFKGIESKLDGRGKPYLIPD